MATQQEVQDEYDALKTAVTTSPTTLADLDAIDLHSVTLCDMYRAGDPKPTGGVIVPTIGLARGPEHCLRGVNKWLSE